MKHRSPVILPAIFSVAIVAAAIWLAAYELHWPWWIGYLVGINLATFLVYGYDKWISSGNHTRIPEIVLHALALVGGTPAALVAQRVWRHKTVKRSFRVRFWIIIFFQCLIIAVSIAWMLVDQRH